MATTAAPKSIQKIIIVGDTGVGKTSIMNRYVSSKFTSHYKATIGADFMPKEVQVGDMSVTLQIWDTAGQERFHSLGNRFYRGSDACVLVYDVTNASSFQRVFSYWKSEFLSRAGITDGASFPLVVMGNKCDSEKATHQVSMSKARAECDRNGGIPHFQVSAKEGLNIDDAFMTVITAALKRPGPRVDIPTLDLKITPPPPKNDCAC